MIMLNSMMTSWNGNIFRVTGHLCGDFTGPGEFPAQRPVTRSFDVFFDLRLNKRLSKQSWGWWFETTWGPLWHHRHATAPCIWWCPWNDDSSLFLLSMINLSLIFLWFIRAKYHWLPVHLGPLWHTLKKAYLIVFCGQWLLTHAPTVTVVWPNLGCWCMGG